MQDPRTVKTFNISFPYTVGFEKMFTLMNVDKATANWYMDHGSTFIAEKVTPKHGAEMASHSPFTYKDDVKLYEFKPSESGFNIFITSKLEREESVNKRTDAFTTTFLGGDHCSRPMTAAHISQRQMDFDYDYANLDYMENVPAPVSSAANKSMDHANVEMDFENFKFMDNVPAANDPLDDKPIDLDFENLKVVENAQTEA